MNFKEDNKEIDQCIGLWIDLPKKDLKELLKQLNSIKPKSRSTENKIIAVKTLLL